VKPSTGGDVSDRRLVAQGGEFAGNAGVFPPRKYYSEIGSNKSAGAP
jgi:hypothetical protein